jgi:YidC/Oxa1 family membrane protein insertase
MDSQRLILAVVFAGSLFMLYQKWVEEHTARPAPSSAAPALIDKTGGANALPPAGPRVAAPPAVAGNAAVNAGASAVTATPAKINTERVTVRTDNVIAEIDGLGGTLTRLEFVKQRDTHDANKGFVLLEESAAHTYVAQSGLLGEAAPGVALPNHNTPYAFEPGPRELKDGEDKLEVRLDAQAGPVKVTKVLVFHRASYVIDERFEIVNQGAAPIQPRAYFQIMRDGTPGPGQQRFVSSFTGPAFYTEAKKYDKIEFKDILQAPEKSKFELPPTSADGWVAMVQHYFVTAWLLPPAAGAQALYDFYADKINSTLYIVGAKFPLAAIAPGASAQVAVPLYSGPQEQEHLAAVAPGLELVTDYGKLKLIAQPLFKVLEWLHKWVDNWGVAIILLTIMIKACFYPLSAASYKSMARMRVITPRLTKLREQYGDDRVKMNQAMMELYKTEKINPLGGCLPIVVQIPVFISLYWVLLASVEMRNAPFVLWIHDLSSPDPFYVLPVIMTITSYVQVKLNPTPPDPVQAKVMMIMPLAFGVMFFFFPAGLVLYWVVNNVLSIAQQWQITRSIEGAKDRTKR